MGRRLLPYRPPHAAGAFAHGHADAAAIETVRRRATMVADRAGPTIDDRLGARWLGTADVVILAVRTGGIGSTRGSAAIHALHAAGRITDALPDAYLSEVP